MNIIFVCHGNICRSVAAEYISKSLDKTGNNFYLSRAISYEEIGNDIYPPMKEELKRNNIPFMHHEAMRINQKDYDWADAIYYMDEENKNYLSKFFIDHKNKIKPIFLYTPNINEIEDPWYTRNFHKVFMQIKQCVEDIIKKATN